MANEKSNKITEAGLAKLQEELDYRVGKLRNEIAQEIEFARSYGDLSENAEYTEAKHKQSENEAEIIRLTLQIRNSEVVADDQISTDRVSVGTSVRVFDYDMDEEVTFAIVGVAEADPFNNKLSDESPIGSGLVGKRPGDEIEVEAPVGVLKFKVLEIMR